MQVELKVKEWKILPPKEGTKIPIIAGEYDVTMDGKSIAKQTFNDGYGSKDVGFSLELLEKVEEIEALITNEIKGML